MIIQLHIHNWKISLINYFFEIFINVILVFGSLSLPGRFLYFLWTPLVIGWKYKHSTKKHLMMMDEVHTSFTTKIHTPHSTFSKTEPWSSKMQIFCLRSNLLAWRWFWIFKMQIAGKSTTYQFGLVHVYRNSLHKVFSLNAQFENL